MALTCEDLGFKERATFMSDTLAQKKANAKKNFDAEIAQLKATAVKNFSLTNEKCSTNGYLPLAKYNAQCNCAQLCSSGSAGVKCQNSTGAGAVFDTATGECNPKSGDAQYTSVEACQYYKKYIFP